MVLYFSGTGNSQYVAEQLAKETQDSCVSLNELMKKNVLQPLVSEEKPFVFVCPTYAWRIPRVVEHFIEKVSFSGNLKTYFILTCGGETANAMEYIQKLCIKKNLIFSGFAEIIMPENYMVLFGVPSESEISTIMQTVPAQVSALSQMILQKHDFPEFHPLQKWKSGFINTLFYKMFVSAKGFHVTDKCIACGKCVTLCPLNNIQMENKLPRWGNDCTHCMACIGGCPTAAIEYKNKTQGKERYYLVNSSEKTQ